jgi:hypothetical protein
MVLPVDPQAGLPVPGESGFIPHEICPSIRLIYQGALTTKA